MRIALEVVAVLERAGLALVDVDGHEPRRRFGRDDLPLAAGREARAAEPAQARVFHLRDDVGALAFARRAGGRQPVAAGRAIRG